MAEADWAIVPSLDAGASAKCRRCGATFTLDRAWLRVACPLGRGRIHNHVSTDTGQNVGDVAVATLSAGVTPNARHVLLTDAPANLHAALFFIGARSPFVLLDTTLARAAPEAPVSMRPTPSFSPDLLADEVRNLSLNSRP